ncbi:MAG: MFS transporter [Pseudomonadota bacterium]
MTTSPALSADSASTPSGRAAALGFFFVNGATFGSWATRIPDVKQRFELSEATLGLVLLAMAIGAVTAFLITANWSERFGSARVSAWTAVGFCLLLPPLAFAGDVVTLAALLFLFGALGGSLDLAMNAYGAEVEARRKTSTMSMLHGFWSLGFGMAAVVGWACYAFEISAIPHFAFMSAAMLVLTFFSTRSGIPAEAEASTPDSEETETRRLTLPLIAMMVVAGSCFLGEGALLDWIAVFAIWRFDVDLAFGASLLAVFSCTMIALRLTGDRIITRLGATFALRASAIAATLGFAALVFAPTPSLLPFGVILAAIGMAMMAPLAFSAAGRSAHPGFAISRVAVGGYAGLLFGPVIIGGIGEVLNLAWAFAALGAIFIPLVFVRLR